MQTANATSGTQFAKPSNYSAYGTAGYDTLNQATQDYNKTAYQSAGVGQQAKGQAVSNQTSDIGSSMYSKSHVALNKVNVSIIYILSIPYKYLKSFLFFLVVRQAIVPFCYTATI